MRPAGRQIVISCGLILGILVSGESDIQGADESAANAVTIRLKAGPTAREILDATGVQGGLVVHLGCGDGKLTAQLAEGESFLVHGLDTDPKAVRTARAHIRSTGRYGRASAEVISGDRLPYAANLVRLIVVSEAGAVPMSEILRVLCPEGVACVRSGKGWTQTRKPRPEEMDDWTHYLYDASNNAVSKDRMVGPPGGLQWVAAPKFSRSHEQLASLSAAVVAGGRIFSIEDRGPIESVAFPPKWILVARDAFNGITLWKREMGTWQWHLHLFRAGPAHLSRRLVAVGDRVYVTLGLGRPLEVLDAATGKTLKTFESTKGADEIVHTGKLLLVYVGHAGQKRDARKRKGGGASTGVARRLMAINPVSGKTVWEKKVSGLCSTTLGAANGMAFYQEGASVVAASLEDGKELWRSEPLSKHRKQPPVVVAYGDMILWADGVDPRELRKRGPGMLAGLDAATGKTIWKSTSELNCVAPPDILVSDGLVWTGKLLLAKQPGITEGLDPKTGKVARSRKPDSATFDVGMPHHRCYRNKGAGKWLILGRAGAEFLDVKTGKIYPNHWVRGTCQYGILPANGMLYAPPHSCACYLTAKINGFNALVPKRRTAQDKPKPPALKRGPAYGKTRDAKTGDGDSNWPTYRHDALRSGRTSSRVPVNLKQLWKANVGRKLTAMTIAGGKCFVADGDAHTIHAIDAVTGRSAWTFTASGRIDSPPTIASGLAVFGCRDGYVYCLRAADGRLVWRFRAAPEDRRIVAYGQLESLWPVNGSVLVQDGYVAFAAGRSSFLDGGIRLCKVELKTGKLLAEATVYTPDASIPKKKPTMFNMEGTHSGILLSDGETVFMQHLSFSSDLKPMPAKPHLFSPTSLLDDSWWHRTYWLYGKEFTAGWSYWFQNGNLVPAGRILAFDDKTVYGFGRNRYRNCSRGGGANWAAQEKYGIFASRKTIDKTTEKGRAAGRRKPVQKSFLWLQDAPLRARAMVLTPETVFFAGQPNFGNSSKDALASYQGQKGAKLVAVAVADGKLRSALDLPAPPVHDGMAAAGGRLYLSLKDGTVICLGSKRAD